MKENTLQFITKWFSILLMVSAVFYLLWFFNIFSFTPTRIQFNDGRYVSNNYYIFTTEVVNLRLADFYRFKSIFMEPGHMTMGIMPLIILNRFNLKNIYVCFLFIAELLSFSLAGMISMFVGYVLLNLNKRVIINFCYGFVFLVGILWGLDRAGYGEVLDVYLWNRIEMTDEGTIAGYNRTTDNFERSYEKLLQSPDCIFGVHEFKRDFGDGGNAGYKPYIYQFGFFGLFLTVCIYVYYLFKYRTYSAFVATLIFLMLLSQDACPTWISVLGAYLLGMPSFSKSRLRRGHVIPPQVKSADVNDVGLRGKCQTTYGL